MVPSWPVCSQISLYLIAYPIQKLSQPRLEINSRLERVAYPTHYLSRWDEFYSGRIYTKYVGHG